MKKISLTEKLILYFLTLGVSAIVIISVFAFFSTKGALMDRTFDQLTSLKIVKRHQIESFFNDRYRDLAFLSASEDSRKIVDLLENLQLDKQLGNQHKKDELISEFDRYINKYQILKSYLSSIIISSSNGFVITGDLQTGKIELEEKQNLTPGYSLIESVILKKKVAIDDAVLSEKDEVPYLLIGSAIEPGKQTDPDKGIILMKIPVESINTIMLNNNPHSGLGTTGETYLVGDDFLMRSASRFIHKSILKTFVKTECAQRAFSGSEGQLISKDYRNIPVLSSFSKTNINGLNWIILAEIDLQEAMIPIYKMRNSILFLGIFISLIFFSFVFLIARKITRPIIHLEDAAIKVGKGEYNIDLPIETNDEIGALTKAFNKMAVQINEKTRELQYERIGRIRSVIDGEESERQRLSRELHDGIGQSLIALKLRLESLLYIENDKIRENIIILKDQVDGTVDEIRRISNNLMPSVLEVFGITLAMKNLCTETGEHSGINIIFECHGDLEVMNTKLKTYIYRIGQEAFTNIVKHSAATEVKLHLSRNNDVITLQISDNGKGFIPEKAAMERGNGLYNMRERVTLLQGTFNIRSVINEGTEIIINLPVF